MDLATMQTNEFITQWVVNNLVLLAIIKYTLDYICKKSPWAWDDDLPTFFGGLIDFIRNPKTEITKEKEEE